MEEFVEYGSEFKASETQGAAYHKSYWQLTSSVKSWSQWPSRLSPWSGSLTWEWTQLDVKVGLNTASESVSRRSVWQQGIQCGCTAALTKSMTPGGWQDMAGRDRREEWVKKGCRVVRFPHLSMNLSISCLGTLWCYLVCSFITPCQNKA